MAVEEVKDRTEEISASLPWSSLESKSLHQFNDLNQTQKRFLQNPSSKSPHTQKPTLNPSHHH